MKPFPKKYKPQEAEADCRRRWADDEAFKWDPAQPAESDYVIDTPPPTVSGSLHVGHVYSYTQADIIARYFRMSGRNVLYPIGWDDNGLPTERLVEKVKKVRGGTMAREEFVDLCREVIPPYEQQFRDLFSRLALSVDWSREYQTISDESRQVSQMSFLDLYRKGLLERRLEPTLWDPADRTAIAQAEVEEKEREGKLNQIPFEIEGGGEPAVIATTRPELIGACGALIIHPEHPRAAELIGKRAITPLYNVPVPIVGDEAVDPEKGTGVVMCCTFGDVQDIAWWRAHKLPLRLVIDQAGKMKDSLPIGTDEWPSLDPESARATVDALAGLKAEKAKAAILEMLSERGLILKQDVTEQVVPVAERSGAPLEIIVTPQWFIRTLDFKDEILAKGREITWRPEYMRQRFESWVEGLKWDWAISRQRHFGVPLPVWYSKRPGEEGKIIVAEADELPVDPTADAPKGYAPDEVEPERDVMDTWATSSVSPQLVTRSINEDLALDYEAHKRLFPMALRPQAHDIIRTWAFYTIVKALHHEQDVPWRNIAISGWCLASDGSKMSKSKGNIIDPVKLLDEYGVDAVRYWTGTSRLGHDTVTSPNTLQQGKRLVTKLWNAVKLAHMALEQAEIDPVSPAADIASGAISHPLDQWLLGRLSETVAKATEAFETYEYAQALRATEDFFWRTYCDNYLEIVKRRTRFEGAPDDGQRSALHTLFHASDILIRLYAPFTPYVTDTLHELLHGSEDEAAPTVHARGSWPKADDQAEAGVFRDEGDAFVAILAAARKVKSELQVSMRAPVTTLTVSGAESGLEAVIGDTTEDLKAVTTAEAVAAGDAPADAPKAASPDERFTVALEMAPAEAAD
ncbi:valine--tRNA ligase [Marinicauda salina]|uniref:Valine--tRNA ligase n=1 Tax=Marinicauda salina TaxID=2135793 RepID=A0A2U2BVJ5_9PROT|nr:valine--tRNA ligase [Marinicauda salina]PWE18051.1 valine--tRNA ligase [Marinicauda salina]